jgi:thioester reductase-like protein
MTVLMTGFPGFLGSELLPGILRRTYGAAICLVQPKFVAVAKQRVAELSSADPALQGRIRLVEGDDVTQPRLGLGADASNEVTEAWHLAAAYDLTVARDVAVRDNVEGTRNVLGFQSVSSSFNRSSPLTCHRLSPSPCRSGARRA